MKKQVKIISIALVIMMALLSISNVVLATGTTGTTSTSGSDIGQIIDDIGKGNNTDTTKVSNFGKTLVTILQTAGIVVAIVVLLVIGIKYMMGSAEEKAEYKKVMIPYLIGAALIFGGSAIVGIVYEIISSGAMQM